MICPCFVFPRLSLANLDENDYKWNLEIRQTAVYYAFQFVLDLFLLPVFVVILLTGYRVCGLVALFSSEKGMYGETTQDPSTGRQPCLGHSPSS